MLCPTIQLFADARAVPEPRSSLLTSRFTRAITRAIAAYAFLQGMFRRATSYNQPTNFDTSSVTTMQVRIAASHIACRSNRCPLR